MQQVSIPSYSESEYNQYLKSEDWSQAETDHLMDLCQRFDLRFIVIHDRWDRAAFQNRSVEDLKERYYGICATLSKVNLYYSIFNYFVYIISSLHCICIMISLAGSVCLVLKNYAMDFETVLTKN